jgi:RimJ/RimL family protein N-acetyltransferase
VPALPVPDLGDGVVRLRPWRSADAPALAAAWADPEIRRHAAVPEAADLERARRWIAGEAERRAAGLALDLVIEPTAEPGAVAGEVGLGPIDWTRATAEIGFWIGTGHRGQGLAARAITLLGDWVLGTAGGQEPAICPQNELTTLVARVSVGNAASGAVLAGAGFERRGRLADGREMWARSSASEPDRGTLPF